MNIEHAEYPEPEQLLFLPDEFCFDYVPSSFLDGIVNHTGHVGSVPQVRYAERSHVEAVDAFKDATKAPDFKASDYGDDVALIRESEHHLWAFCYDMYCSECSLIRIRKSRPNALAEMVKLLPGENAESDVLTEPKPGGWISF